MKYIYMKDITRGLNGFILYVGLRPKYLPEGSLHMLMYSASPYNAVWNEILIVYKPNALVAGDTCS